MLPHPHTTHAQIRSLITCVGLFSYTPLVSPGPVAMDTISLAELEDALNSTWKQATPITLTHPPPPSPHTLEYSGGSVSTVNITAVDSSGLYEGGCGSFRSTMHRYISVCLKWYIQWHHTIVFLMLSRWKWLTPYIHPHSPFKTPGLVCVYSSVLS